MAPTKACPKNNMAVTVVSGRTIESDRQSFQAVTRTNIIKTPAITDRSTCSQVNHADGFPAKQNGQPAHAGGRPLALAAPPAILRSRMLTNKTSV